VPKLLILALIGLALVLFWRRWSRQGRESFIRKYPYVRFLDARLAKRRPELSPEQRAEVLAGLEEYFQVCRQAGRRMVAMPSQVVDDAWHEFILFTRHYENFCRNAFGRFLHHTPAEAMSSPTQASHGIKRAWRLACAREKINPKDPHRLPGLFALDAKLSIAGGFIYQLDCMASYANTAQGTTFCASHIGCGGSGGCGGGCSGDSSDSGSDGGGDGGGCGGD
jgi:hypothetical protein